MKIQLSRVLPGRWMRRLFWLAGAIALSWALGWALVPPLLKSQAQKALTEALGRAVTIGHIDFKPWTLELTVQDVRVAAAGGAASDKPALLVKRIYVDAELVSLFRLAPVVDAVLVEGLALRVAHVGEGRYDFDDILKRQPRADGQPAGEPARFAVYNLELRDASISFDDRPAGKIHELSELHFSLPFLSNLPSQREIKVQPRLAFKLNGSSFDSSADGTPFAQTRKTDLSILVKRFDLAPYLVYWPASAPVKLRSAVIDADLRLAFEQAGRTSLGLSGTVQVSGVKLDDYRSRELLSLDTVAVRLGLTKPLEREIHIDLIEVEAPQAVLRRDASGRVDLLPDVPQSKEEARPEAGVPDPNAWRVQLDRFTLRSGRATWQDESVRPAARLAVQDLALEIKDVHWPFPPADQAGKGAPVQASLVLQGARRAGVKVGAEKSAGSISLKGHASDTQGEFTVTAAALDLTLGAPYLGQFLVPDLSGQAQAEVLLKWGAAERQIMVNRLVLDDLALKTEKTSLASLARLELSGAQIDLVAQNLHVSKVLIDRPKAALSRGKDGHWMYEAWTPERKAGGTTTAAASPAAQARTGAAGAQAEQSSWGVSVAEFNLADGAFSLRDELPQKSVAVELSALKLRLRNLVPLRGKPATPKAGAKSMAAAAAVKGTEVAFSARLAHGSTEPGTVSYKGSLSLEPLATQGAVDISRFPAHAFEAYAADRLNVEVLRADASFKGEIAYAAEAAAGTAPGMRLTLKGDSALEELRVMTLPVGLVAGATQIQGAEELLNWKLLSLRGLSVALAPAAAPQVDIAQTVLSDFFARVIIDAQGNLNLQNLLKPDPAAAASAPLAGTVASAERPQINFGPISMVNGRVQFSDRFIRPNYSAALSELTGSLSGFSSTSPQMADLDLRGKAEGTASLEITGKLNPLVQPLALDIKAKVRDLELSPMTPYSVKYAGHGIQRGKLSVDLAYLVKPNGELTAANKLVLNQLTFGDKVEGAPNSLPVKLAVALLADRNGVIDIDLPISGSLNDPEFKLGPIIFKVIVNLIVKAITAPFSLLASAFGGGGDELSMVGFDPGSAQLTDRARQGLDKVAKALVERPALKMTVEGGASVELERDALKRERLNSMVVAEKRRQLVLAGAKLPAQADAPLTPTTAEYPELLTQVYRRAELPKPLDSAGKPKELPASEMEALLMSYIKIDEESMRELAQERGVAVRDYLASKQLPTDRLFLGPVKVAGTEANWTPRANLVLATP